MRACDEVKLNEVLKSLFNSWSLERLVGKEKCDNLTLEKASMNEQSLYNACMHVRHFILDLLEVSWEGKSENAFFGIERVESRLLVLFLRCPNKVVLHQNGKRITGKLPCFGELLWVQGL